MATVGQAYIVEPVVETGGLPKAFRARTKDHEGDASKVPDTNFLFDEIPTIPDEPVVITRKLTFLERLRGKVVDEIPQEKPKFPEDKPSDPSYLRAVLGVSSGMVSDQDAIIAYKGKKGVPLAEDPAVLALRQPRVNPELAKAFEELEKQYHEIVIKLPKAMRVTRDEKRFYTRIVKDLINNKARTVIYTPSI